MPIASRWRKVRVQGVWLVMRVQCCHVHGGRGGRRGVASGGGVGCGRGVMIIGRVADTRLRGIVVMVRVRGSVAQRLALSRAKYLLLLLLLVVLVQLLLLLSLLLLSVEVRILTSLSQSIFHLLLDSYSVVLVPFDNVLRALLEEPLDHGVPASQIIVGVVSQCCL